MVVTQGGSLIQTRGIWRFVWDFPDFSS